MGSITHIVDETGEVQNRYEYDAWGNLTFCEETIPNRFKFTGQQLDPITQQYYLRARFYNPVIARFTQEDTYRGDGLNLYAYYANNPVFYVDPMGHYSDCVKDAYDRIRGEDPTLSANVAYQRALQERGFDKLSKEDNHRRSEAANLNRQLKDPSLTPEQRKQIFEKLDEINNEFSSPNQQTNKADVPDAKARRKEDSDSQSPTTRVGRWMSQAEYDKMIKTGKIQMSGDNKVHVANPADINAFGKQAPKGSLYVEFDVQSNTISAGGKVGWGIVSGPGSLLDSLYAKKGLPRILEMPNVINIKIEGSK